MEIDVTLVVYYASKVGNFVLELFKIKRSPLTLGCPFLGVCEINSMKDCSFFVYRISDIIYISSKLFPFFILFEDRFIFLIVPRLMFRGGISIFIF